MSTEITLGLFTLGGMAVGAVSTWVVTFINRRFDDRRHLRETAIQTAIRYWELDTEIAKLKAEATRTTIMISPLDTYIIHMMLLAEAVASKRITAENVAAELQRIRRVSHAAHENAKRHPKDA